MSTPFKPPAHNAVSPYLLVSSGERMLDFLSAVFNAEEIYKATLPDGSVKHAEVLIDDSVVMLGERPEGGDPIHCSIHVYVPDVDAAYAKALAAGASSISEPRDQPYGDRSAGIKDHEGNLWWLGTHKTQQAGTA
jgi:uncharacterized glyoxalase superfamily protein PhnB